MKRFTVVVLLLLAGLLIGLGRAPRAEAGIFNASEEVTYKEYWVPHTQFTAGCTPEGLPQDPNGSWYVEPGLLTKMAGCCKLAPPDPIVGYITQGHGVTVHRADCPMIVHLTEDKRARLLRAAWGGGEDQLFAVDVELLAQDRQGLLKDVSEILAQEKINVIRVNTLSQQHTARMEFTLEVKDLNQLTRFLARVEHVRGMHEARRK